MKKKIECALCKYEYPKEGMIFSHEAYICGDCQDFHAGYLCQDCYKGEITK
jgi:hypothetical protein